MDLIDENLHFDRMHLWHPYSSMRDPLPVYPVASAEGALIRLADGRELIDGMSSWWCTVHGYNHPEINRAISEQLAKTSHVMFGGITHEPAIELGKKLVAMTPAELDTVFLADSGSVSVEVAIKMAVQYQHARGFPEKKRMATVRGGYYGDTTGAMALCDPVTGMHSMFSGVLMEHEFIPRPTCRYDEPWNPVAVEPLYEDLLGKHRELAGVIIEPVVQGAGGMWFYHPEYLVKLREICNELDLVLIFDEIATGFGRTGKLFAAEWAGVCPDIMTVGKALTGGYMTLAATLATQKIAQGICADDGVMMHGPTFMANPLACAAANASLKLLQEGSWQADVARLEHGLKEGLAPARAYAHVKDVRVLGAIGVIETEAPVNVAEIQKAFVERGVWIRPFGRLTYLMPPFITSDKQLAQLTSVLVDVIAEHGMSRG